MHILRRGQKEMPEVKNTLTEVKDALDGFISRLDIAKERIYEFKDMLIDTSKTKRQREKRLKKY